MNVGNNVIREYLAEIGRRGGQAGRGKAKARSSKQARKAAKARWDKRTEQQREGGREK